MPVSPPALLLRVATTWPLPGLGLLALSSGPTPHLMAYALHAAVAVEAVLPNGTRHAATATVEEISLRAVPERGLLLDLGSPVALPAGSEIWLDQSPMSSTEQPRSGASTA